MFVLCPSCAGPFRIPADQIAPLVQIACPHCEFRMILDFEAANEPSLAEPGQLFAQGFESAEAYFSVYSHVGPQTEVTPRRVEAPARPAEAPATKAPPTSPAATPPASTPAVTPPVAATPPPSTPPTEAPRSVGNKTIIQAPKRPVSMEPKPEAPAATPSAGSSMRAGNKAIEIEPVAEAKVSAVQPEPRIPPHTPPAATVTSNPPAPSEPTTPPRAEDIAAQSGSHPPGAKQEATSKPSEPEKKPVANPPPPTGSSSVVYIAVALAVIAAIAIAVYLNMK